MRELRLHDDTAEISEGEIEKPALRFQPSPGARDHLALFELIGSPCLGNLRLLQVGDESGGEEGWTDCHCHVPGLEHVLPSMPRLEQLILLCRAYDPEAVFGLHTLTHLRVLQAEHLDDHAVEVLASNPALRNLTHLWFHPHYDDVEFNEAGRLDGFLPLSELRALVESPYLKRLTHLRFRLSSAGDAGIRLMIESGFLAQLRLLDLRHGCVTDEGARLLAEYPDLKTLELLDLSRNQLTTDGIALLRATGVNLRCDDQRPVGSTEYLTEGDFE